MLWTFCLKYIYIFRWSYDNVVFNVFFIWDNISIKPCSLKLIIVVDFFQVEFKEITLVNILLKDKVKPFNLEG